MHATRDFRGMCQSPHGDSRREVAQILRGIPAAFGENVIDHAGMNLTGAHRIDADIVARMIQGHAAGDLNHRSLAGAVSHMIGFAVEAPFRRDVHDGPLAGGLHVLDRGAAQVEQRVDVHRHGVEPLLVAGIERIGRVEDAGIVDQNVQSSHAPDGIADQAVTGARGAHIHRGELRVAALRSDGLDHGATARFMPARYHDLGSGLREHVRAGLADPCGRARDQNHFSRKDHGRLLRPGRQIPR